MDEKAYYSEGPANKPARLQCPFCRTTESYELRWLVRKKKDRLPPGGDERDRAKFQKAQSYMVLLDDKVACKNLRCRKRFDISGVKTMAFLYPCITPQPFSWPPSRASWRPAIRPRFLPGARNARAHSNRIRAG